MTVKIHAIETGKVQVRPSQPIGQGRDSMRYLNVLLDTQWTEWLPIYCWLIEHPTGLYMIDTGETAKTANPGHFPAWQPFYHNVKFDVKPHHEVGAQIEALGYAVNDIRTVVLTHMHTDHAGALYTFPNAEYIVSAAEFAATRGLRGKLVGYLTHHWPDWFAPMLIGFEGGSLGAFDARYDLANGITLLPTPGHAAGHLSVLVETDSRPVFIAGDVSYTEAQLHTQQIDGVTPDAAQGRDTMRRTLETVTARDAIYLPSHDPESATRLAAALPTLA